MEREFVSQVHRHGRKIVFNIRSQYNTNADALEETCSLVEFSPRFVYVRQQWHLGESSIIH